MALPDEVSPSPPVRRARSRSAHSCRGDTSRQGIFTRRQQLAAIRFESRRVWNALPLQNQRRPSRAAECLFVQPFAQCLTDQPATRLAQLLGRLVQFLRGLIIEIEVEVHETHSRTGYNL